MTVSREGIGARSLARKSKDESLKQFQMVVITQLKSKMSDNRNAFKDIFL